MAAFSCALLLWLSRSKRSSSYWTAALYLVKWQNNSVRVWAHGVVCGLHFTVLLISQTGVSELWQEAGLFFMSLIIFISLFLFLSLSSFRLHFSSQVTAESWSETGQYTAFASFFMACFCLLSYIEKNLIISAKHQKYIQLELPFSKMLFPHISKYKAVLQ